MSSSQQQPIVIIGPAYPYRGGPALVVAHTYEQLQKKHNVEVFSFSRLYPSLLFPGVRQEDISKHPAKQHPVHRTIDSIQPLTWISTAKQIRALKPKLVIVDWYQPFFGACYYVICSILKAAGIPILFFAENVISHEARFIDSALTSLALGKADSFIAFSESVEQRLRTMYPTKQVQRSTLPLFFTNNEAPTQWTQEGAKEQLGLQNKRVLLFFGYIRKYKGLRNLIQAFPSIAELNPNTHLLIVGECYENAQEYNQLIEQSGVADRITWINEYVPNEDIALYYNAADIVVLPYNSATQSGIVKIAFGFEKPVLATAVGGLTEEIKQWNAGIVVPSSAPADLIQGANHMLALQSLSVFSQGARKAKESNSFEHIVELVEAVLV